MYNPFTLTSIFDVLALGLIFWAFPFTLAKFVAGRASDSTFRPLKALMKDLPGTVNGLAIGAFALYAFGASFEDFAVSTARAAGNEGMKLVGIDEISRCKARMVEKHKLDPESFVEKSTKPRRDPTHSSDIERAYEHVVMLHMLGPDHVLPAKQAMDYGLTKYCEEIAGRGNGTGAINPLGSWQTF